MASRTSEATRQKIIAAHATHRYNMSELGRLFGVSQTTVSTIIDPAYARYRNEAQQRKRDAVIDNGLQGNKNIRNQYSLSNRPITLAPIPGPRA